MNELVSILIPAFNAERWIAQTIESALAQTWPRKEIIIVDDGSTDDTVAVAQQFNSEELTVVRQPNQGAAAARNKAYSLSHGDYIQWLDADDVLAPDKIAQQLKARNGITTSRTLFSSAWGHFIRRIKNATFTPTCLWQDLTPIGWLISNLESGAFLQTASWLVSRELTESAGPWDIRLLGDDDGEYFSRVVRACNAIRFVPESKTFYRRVTSNRLSHVGRSDKKLEAHFLAMKLQVQNILSLEDSPRVRSACIASLQRFMTYFYPERPDILKQLEQLALTLGGAVQIPKLSWKYAWIQKLFGWTIAKESQIQYNHYKAFVFSYWDTLLFRLGI